MSLQSQRFNESCQIADLEITNRSLMSINATLESVKHRQAKEIRDLRRKLRESRLILPPPAYRAVQSPTDNDTDENDDDESDSESTARTVDETYRRVKTMIELLLETGRKALESKVPDDLEGARGGTKVLNADEVRSWRDSADENDFVNMNADLALLNGSGNPRSVRNNDNYTSEEEVEDMITPDAATSSPIPPIHITPSL